MPDPVTMATVGKVAGKMALKQMAAGAEKREEGKPTMADSARAAAQVGTDANNAIAGITPAISWPDLIKAYGLAR